MADNVYTVLRYLFSKDFAKSVRLTSTSNKLAVKNTKIGECIRGKVCVCIFKFI